MLKDENKSKPTQINEEYCLKQYFISVNQVNFVANALCFYDNTSIWQNSCFSNEVAMPTHT